MPTTTRGCSAASRSASTITFCVRSTRTNCWRARAPKFASAAIPIICATMCRIPSRPRLRMPLPACKTRLYRESHLGTLAEQASSRGKPLALMMLDIDFFKSINDNYGHDAGDGVLREFAVRVRKSIRGIDLACRYGGEEFVIVMPETDLHVAGMVAERLRRSIAREPFAVNKGSKRIEVTISIGLSTLELKGEAVADVLKRADTALYRAKHDGRNRVVSQAA